MIALAFWLLLTPNVRGAHAFQQGNFALAERLFTAAWELQPHANIASNLGAVSRRLNKWPEAGNWFDTVYQLRRAALGPAHPDTIIARNNRGIARLHAGRLSEARADLEAALEAAVPGSADQASILANLGALAMEQARLGEALRHCAQAFAINPEAGRPCRERLGRLAVAVEAR